MSGDIYDLWIIVLETLSVPQLHKIARALDMSSTTRLTNRRELARAIATWITKHIDIANQYLLLDDRDPHVR